MEELLPLSFMLSFSAIDRVFDMLYYCAIGKMYKVQYKLKYKWWKRCAKKRGLTTCLGGKGGHVVCNKKKLEKFRRVGLYENLTLVSGTLILSPS
jgi:hypothetical protein